MFFDLLNLLFGKIFFFTGMVRDGTFPKPLSPEDERKYLALAREGDAQAKEILIKHNMRLVAHVVKKSGRQGYAACNLYCPLHRKRNFNAAARRQKA